jgi:hypothetical protein
MYRQEPFYSDGLRQHLRRFMDLTCGHEHAKFCKRSQRIVELLDGDLADVA